MTLEQGNFMVPPESAGQRADVFLAAQTGYPRSRVTGFFSRGQVQQGGRTLKRSDRVLPGQTLLCRAFAPGPETMCHGGGIGDSTSAEKLAVVYEDDDLIVVDKPAHMAVHRSGNWCGPTVNESLRSTGVKLAPDPDDPTRFGVVHRLDANTTGLMTLAKTTSSWSALKQAWREHQVVKEYQALAHGYVVPESGTIRAPIGRDPLSNARFAVIAGGRDAVTHYRTLECLPGAVQLQIRLETGRTHQIRVHFSALRHPLLGDVKYGADPMLAQKIGLGRQWLHAVRLAFKHPHSGEALEFISEPTAELQNSRWQLGAMYVS